MKKQCALFRPLRRIGSLMLALTLAGCGGGDDGGHDSNTSPLPPSVVDTVLVSDGFSAVQPGSAARVDLSAFVRGRGTLTLTSLQSDQAGCGATTASGLQAEVNIDDGGLCTYTYTASNGSSSASARLNVLASRASEPVLEPISWSMSLGDNDLELDVFDLMDILEVSLPGYNLDSSSVMISSDPAAPDSAQGETSVHNISVIHYSPSRAGWDRIVFVLKNPSLPDEDILGSIYITVSEKGNHAPTIAPVRYDYLANNAFAPIVTFQDVTLDLANLSGLAITDQDGDDWQLIEVQSYSATVASKDLNNVANKKFTFRASAVGEHIVSYIVGDHKGGYRMGLMSIQVGPKEQPKNWVNIPIHPLVYNAPPLYSEARRKVTSELVIEPAWDRVVNSGAGNTVGAMGPIAGGLYCGGARLPSAAEMLTLKNSVDSNVTTKRTHWPQERSYLTYDGVGTYGVYDLATGSTGPVVSGVNYYVSCINDINLSFTLSTTTNGTLLADNTYQEVGSVTSTGGADVVVTTGGTLTGTDVGAVLNSTSLDNYQLTAKSPVAGTAVFKVTNTVTGGYLNTPLITFKASAKLGSLTVVNNSALADNTALNTVVAQMVDDVGNPVGSVPVTLTFSKNSANASFTGSNATGVCATSPCSVNTDSAGKITLSLKDSYSAGENVTVTAYVQGAAIDQATAIVTFAPWIVAFPALSNVNTHINPYIFAINAGFPTTGFVNAKFQIQIEGVTTKNGNYTWSTSQPSWTSVSAQGVVSLAEAPTIATKTVTIMATPASGASHAYTFTVNKWFVNAGVTTLVWQDIEPYCNMFPSLSYTMVYKVEFTNSIGVGKGGTRMPTEGIWPEWGTLTAYSSGFQSLTYWLADAGSTANEHLMGGASLGVLQGPFANSGTGPIICVAHL